MIDFRGGIEGFSLFIDIPFAGMLNVFYNWRDWNRKQPFFDTDHTPGCRRWWAGPLRAEFGPDASFRPGLKSYLLVLALAGWTEGHLWHAPEALGGWGVVGAMVLLSTLMFWIDGVLHRLPKGTATI